MDETSIEVVTIPCRIDRHERADGMDDVASSPRPGDAVGKGAKPMPPGSLDGTQRRLAIEAAGVALWSWNVDDDTFAMDERAFALWGLPGGEAVTFEDLSSNIHPADRDRVRAAFTGSRTMDGAYEVDFRIEDRGAVRWVSARGQGADLGMVGRIMSGIFLDVTGRKRTEEGHQMLAGEMSHRVKNLLAIAIGLTATTSRSTTTSTDMARELTQRLTALGRAHDLVRPLPGDGSKSALIGDLIAVLLAPYDDIDAPNSRIRVSVPEMGVGETAVATLALVVHELATNSLKYGALSSPGGTLDVSCSTLDSVVEIVWTERGGPKVAAPSAPFGYGNGLLARAMTRHTNGSVTREWNEAGLVVTLTMDAAHLAT